MQMDRLWAGESQSSSIDSSRWIPAIPSWFAPRLLPNFQGHRKLFICGTTQRDSSTEGITTTSGERNWLLL